MRYRDVGAIVVAREIAPGGGGRAGRASSAMMQILAARSREGC
jgi:hypothetical protein